MALRHARCISVNNDVTITLEKSRDTVLTIMSNLGFVSSSEINKLKNIKLGLLRKNSVYRHGVTRFLPTLKWNAKNANPSCVRVVDIHPLLLEPEWIIYREIILYHEFIHCLGHIGHNNAFYTLESLWPTIDQKKELGKKFMEILKLRNSSWKWKCLKCNMHVLRQRKSSGRYLCRRCNHKLVDEAI
jgi:DNA-directed RNA polymerase subunit RPC12/RpoP